MKEEWRSVSMRHGEQSVIVLDHIMATGISLRLMLFVNSWDTQKLVSCTAIILINITLSILIIILL